MLKKLIDYKGIAVAVLLVFFLAACQDDDIVPQDPEAGKTVTDAGTDSLATAGSYAEVNKWIYSVLGDLYYWNDQLPLSPDLGQEPSIFFKSMQYSGDRFSLLVPDYDKLISSLNGVNMEAGYEYMLSRESGSETGVVAVVLYIKNNSPASYSGLKRGDVISAVNGVKLNMSNYKELIGQTSSSHTLTFRRYEEQNGEYVQQEEISLGVVELAENPSHLDTVFTVGNNKIGYYVYNFFSPGTTGGEYDQQMAEVFAGFKHQGVNELVLDLRYNSGGAISSATTLGSLIGKGVDDSNIYYENRWNANYQEYWGSKSNANEILQGRFKAMAANIGNNLSSGKLYVIVGSRTASASELLINGLKPYMDVFLIGEKTVGKNVGSIAIDDEDNPENKYGMLPIVMQIYNSQGFSDYEDGFEPDVLIEEFKALPLRALGDLQEPLLAQAIQQITGVIASGGKDGKTNGRRLPSLHPMESSLDAKTISNRLIYDLPRD